MPLLFPDTRVPDAEIRQMFREFVDELTGLEKLMASPPAEVLEPFRLETGRDLLADTLAAVRALDPSTLSRSELRTWVNLQYDVSRSTVDCLKSATRMPAVPPPRPKR